MDSFVTIVIWVVLLFGSGLLRLVQHLRGKEPADESPRSAQPAEMSAHVRAALAARTDQLDARVAELVRETRGLGPMARVVESMAEYASERIQLLRASLAHMHHAAMRHAMLDHLEQVERAVRAVVAQRAATRELVRDAQALARACHEPLLEPLRAGALLPDDEIVVALAPDHGALAAHLELAALPGLVLVPAGLDRSIGAWAGVAHAAARHLLGATPGLDSTLRSAAGVPAARVAAELSYASYEAAAWQLTGLFFTELTCDALATLCLGPAYGEALVAAADEHTTSARILRTYRQPAPAPLRIMACARALDAAGDPGAAASLRQAWAAAHDEPGTVSLSVPDGELELPRATIEAVIDDVIAVVIAGRLPELGHIAFADVAALQPGAQRTAEARRARDELRAGRVPATRDARRVIAGAILAWRAQPGSHDAILELARGAISGRARPGAQARPTPAPGAAPEATARRAFVLHTLLAAPPGLGPMARTRARPSAGVLARPRWPRTGSFSSPLP